jgi:6-phosphogluconolactonase
MADGKVGEAVAVKQHEGSGPDARRQKGPHAHEAVFSPDNRFLLVADLGLDQVMVYRFDAAKGTITPNDPPSGKVAPGAGVRHLVFHPKGSVVYAINEMGSTVTAFRYDREKGTLTEFQTVTTLPQGFTGTSSTAEIGINRAGTVLYGSNRGHNSVAVFSIDPAKFTLTPAGHTSTQGKTPRHFTLDPTGKWLIAENQDGGGIVLFRVDQKTGQLTPEGQPLTDAPFPVCVVFVPVS